MAIDYAAEKRGIDAVVAQFFAVFTNKDGLVVDLDTLRKFCLSDCVVIKTCGDPHAIYDLSGFIAPRQKLLSEGELVNFSEKEIWENTEIFGSIAQRFCLYTKSGVLMGERFEARGMKSIQLIKTVEGWKISAVTWDDERDGVAIPGKYAERVSDLTI